MEEIEVNVLTLEDNNEYMVISALNDLENKYLILARVEDTKDIVIRKVIKEEDKEYLINLDNEEEFNKVMKLFQEKYGDE